MAGEPNRATSSRIQQSLPPGGSKRHTCWIPNSHCSQGMMETIKGDMEAEIANGKKQDKENQACQDQLVGDSFCVSTPSIMLIWFRWIWLEVKTNCLQTAQLKYDKALGDFLKWWYPQIIQFLLGFSIGNYPAIGVPWLWKPRDPLISPRPTTARLSTRRTMEPSRTAPVMSGDFQLEWLCLRRGFNRKPEDMFRGKWNLGLHLFAALVAAEFFLNPAWSYACKMWPLTCCFQNPNVPPSGWVWNPQTCGYRDGAAES